MAHALKALPPLNPSPRTTLPADLHPIAADLGLAPEAFAAEATPRNRFRTLAQGSLAAEAEALEDDAWLLVAVPGRPTEADLARVRNELWPACHVVRVYRVVDGPLVRDSMDGRVDLGGDVIDPTLRESCVLAARTRTHVMSPSETTVKFDANAVGWNGHPGSPGYPHFRWMRRFVGCFAKSPATRILDFGCGAGWVGIEAALARANGSPSSAPELCFFDPSPAMVEIAEGNARDVGLGTFTGRVGFGEEPPFPAEGEDPFDLVISSGVLSFSPDLDRWLEGLVAAVAAGGTLVVGDLNPGSLGMRARRNGKPLLPVRELNARTAAEMRRLLEARGFVHEETAGYQLTRPVPQAMHLSETRLRGVLSPPLLLLNKAMSALDRSLADALGSQFDSWVMRFRAPR